METTEGRLLRIFVGEADHHEGLPTYEWLVRTARREGLAGATVLRGLEGYGSDGQLHKTSILRLAVDLPCLVEIVDTAEKIEAFLPHVREAVGEGMATLERVEMIPLGRKRD